METIAFAKYFQLLQSQNWSKFLKIVLHLAKCNSGQLVFTSPKSSKVLISINEIDIAYPELNIKNQSHQNPILHNTEFVSFKVQTPLPEIAVYIQLKVDIESLNDSNLNVLNLTIHQIEDTLNSLYQNALLEQQNNTLQDTQGVIENLLKTFGHMTLIFDENAIIQKIFGNRDLILDKPNIMTGKSIYDYPELVHIKDELKIKIQEFKNKEEVFTIDYSLKKDQEQRWFKSKIKPFTNLTTNQRYFLAFILDVTQQVVAKKEIEEVNELLIETGKLAKVGAWILDLKSKSVYCSKVTQDLFELDDYKKISIPEFLNFFKTPESKKSIYQLIRKTLLRKVSSTAEFKINTRKGNGIWVNIKINAEFNDKNLVKLYGSIQDISNFKKIENELIVEQNRLSHIIEGSNLGAWEWNAITDQAVHNHKWAKILGYDPEEILPIDAEKWEKLIHPDDLPKYNYLMAQHLKGETPFYKSEIRLKAKDGTYKWILDRGKVISYNENGIAEKVYGTHRDITKEKITEIKLKDNLNRFKTIFNFSPVGILLSDFQTAKYIEVNEAILKLTGYNKKEFSELSIWELSKHPKTASDKKQLKLLSEKGVFGPYEKELVNKNGVSFIALMQGKSFFTSEGEQRVLTIITDITKDKKVAKELEEKSKQAKIANQAKSEFLANMSHEMKTPLNGIIGFSDLITNSSLSDTQKMYMRTIKSSAQTLKGLISDVLDFSQIEAGKLEINIAGFSLEQMIREVTHVVQHLAFEKDLQLILNIPTELPEIVYADQLKIKQVLINLINNGLKFTDEGYVKLDCKIENKSKEKTRIKFVVEDTGKGIKPENKRKIFEAFTQEDSSINREKGGTGLGLAISNKLLGLMDSQLVIESELKKGSKFSFTLEVKHNNQLNKSPKIETEKNIGLYKPDPYFCKFLSSQIPQLTFAHVNHINEIKPFDFLIINYRNITSDNEIKKVSKAFDPNKIILLIDSNIPENLITFFESKKIKRFIYQPFLPVDFLELICRFNDAQNNNNQSKIYSNTTKEHLELKFLVAEDNSVNMRLLLTYLNNLYEGVELYKAKNGREALEVFKEEKIDLIITDIQMPEMNGFVLSKKIRRLKKGESTPIIAITAGQIKDHIKLSKKAGIDLTISKPILQDDLKNKLSPYISKILDSKAKIQLNMDFINQIVGDEISEVKEFLKTSLLSICDSKKQIQNDIKLKNFDQLAKSFHKIKGTLLYLDLNKMADQAQKLQKSALHKEENAILKGEAFVNEINELIQVIEEKISNL